MSKSKTTVVAKQPGDLVLEIGNAMMELFSPAIAKAEGIAISGTRNPEDTGNTKPVPVNLVFLLRGIVQQIKTILKGAPKTSRTGRTVFSIKDTRDYYQAGFCKLEQKHSDNIEQMVVDPQYQYVTSRMEAAFAAYDVFSHLETLFEELYKSVAHEDWKPYEAAPTQTALAAGLAEAAKKAALERHTKLKAMAS